jgi:hypothetical protein
VTGAAQVRRQTGIILVHYFLRYDPWPLDWFNHVGLLKMRILRPAEFLRQWLERLGWSRHGNSACDRLVAVGTKDRTTSGSGTESPKAVETAVKLTLIANSFSEYVPGLRERDDADRMATCRTTPGDAMET